MRGSLFSLVRIVTCADAFLRRFHTLRYYRAGQIFARLIAAGKRRFARVRLQKILERPPLCPRGQRIDLLRPAYPSARLVRSLDWTSLEILGHNVVFSRLPDWQAADAEAPTRLWRFHLHYHEFLETAAINDSKMDGETIWEWIDAWIHKFGGMMPEAVDDAWHPYVVSRRIPVWVKLLQSRPPPAPLRQRIVASLTAQSRWLVKNLEWDVQGNHLLQNLRALAVAGTFFSGSEVDRWLDLAGAILRDQLREQMLPHGEHFERSPAYHIDALLALADIRAAGRVGQAAWATQLEAPIERMALFLSQILHPDGQIPLFGDSTLDQYPAPSEVFAALGVPRPPLDDGQSQSNRIGDYWVFRRGGNCMVFDAGPVGPDHLPAHAHADLLNCEASWHGKRLFVDGGVADYEDSPERAFCRGTSAHNVLEIDGQNQCDVWSRFRMGRRGWPEKLRCGQDGPFHWAWCAHNAYRFLGVPRVGRLLVCASEGPWVIVDWAEGRGEHRFVQRLRLGPDWRVAGEGGDRLIVTDGQKSLSVCSLSQAEIHCRPSRYYPFFGRGVPVTVLEQETAACPPWASGWIVACGDDEPPKVEVDGEAARVYWRGASVAIVLV